MWTSGSVAMRRRSGKPLPARHRVISLHEPRQTPTTDITDFKVSRPESHAENSPRPCRPPDATINNSCIIQLNGLCGTETFSDEYNTSNSNYSHRKIGFLPVLPTRGFESATNHDRRRTVLDKRSHSRRCLVSRGVPNGVSRPQRQIAPTSSTNTLQYGDKDNSVRTAVHEGEVSQSGRNVQVSQLIFGIEQRQLRHKRTFVDHSNSVPKSSIS